MRFHLLVVIAACLVVLGGASELASAAVPMPVCGARDPGTKERVRGTLVLKDAESTVTKNYRAEKGDRSLTLVYGVEGCAIDSSVRAPTVSVKGSNAAGKDFPVGSVEASTPTLDDPHEIIIDLTAHLDELHPASYSGLVEIRAPSYLSTTRSLIAVSRSSSFFWALLLSGIAAVFGIAWASFQTKPDSVPDMGRAHFLMLVVAGLVAGIGAGWGSWLAQEVWTVDDNWWTALVAGFTAATTGALFGVLRSSYATDKSAVVKPPAGGGQDEAGEAAAVPAVPGG